MSNIYCHEINIIGLSLENKTTNENGQSNIDCSNLWNDFIKRKLASKIPGKLSEEIYAVYHHYDGDETKPYSFIIGCPVNPGINPPNGLDSLIIPGGTYQKITAKGKMPDCIADVWKNIWNSDIQRAYKTDFEVYDERSLDWNNAEVDIFISVL